MKLQVNIKQMIIDKKWPGDFGRHYKGTPRYTDIIRYCRKQGYIVSKSAIGRFALRVQSIPFEPCIFGHLAQICQEFSDMQRDILESIIHPKISPMSLERRKHLERLTCENLLHIVQVVEGLRNEGKI
jgi:hypothetical protein